jgi:hypothetical protein
MKHRKFNGETFSLAFNRSTKDDALGMKKHIQNNGGSARVVKLKDSYEIYAQYSTLGRIGSHHKRKEGKYYH